MKQLIYINLFFLISVLQGYSQDYTPFDLTDTKWVMSRLVPSAGNNATVSFFEIYTKGDTMINDKSYTIIATKNLCRLYNSPSGVTSEDDIVKEEYEFGAIREEDKRVYYYRYNDEYPSGYYSTGVIQEPEIDHLLYDFNAEAGDTIYHSSEVFTIIIDSYISSDGVKVYEYMNTMDESFANPCDAVIREGRGSGDGLFAPYFGYFTELKCYASDSPLDGVACTVCKDYITSTEDIYPTNSNVLYPNPAHNQLFIHDEYVGELKGIVVYNIQGQKVDEMIYNKGDNSINLLDFASGLLIFELEFSNGQRKLEKIVVRN